MTLLAEVQRLFERTYGREAGVDLEACVVGPRRCAELAARCGPTPPEMSGWARFFYYVEDANLRLALFYAEEMIETLERRDPRKALTESNVLPLLVFTEEASHALHTTYAFEDGGPARVAGEEFLAELELLARIDAYLLLRHVVRAHGAALGEKDLAWVRHEALDRWDVPYDDPRLAERYGGAARLATAFVARLEEAEPERRLEELRAFRALSMVEKRARARRSRSARPAGSAGVRAPHPRAPGRRPR